MKRKPRKKVWRRCAHCGRRFPVDPRLGPRHRFCAQPECAHASHLRSQRKWRRSLAGRDYFRDGESTFRVREWRRANPGSGRRSDRRANFAIGAPLARALRELVLQDLMDTHLALLIGLVAERTNLAQQDAIATALCRIMLRGHAILQFPGPAPVPAEGPGPAAETGVSQP